MSTTAAAIKEPRFSSRAFNLTHLPREARDTLFLLAVIGWSVMPHVNQLPIWCSLLAGLVLLWRGRIAIKSLPMPGKWWLAVLLVAACAGTWFSHRTLLGRDAGVTLLVVLLALKTLELRARRDAFVVFFLGFFILLTNFFYSQTLLTAAAMLVAVVGLLTALVNAHRVVGRPSLWQSAKTAMWMALLGAPIMAALFVLFPRFAPLWGIPSDGMTGRSGLSNNMKVGTIASLALDDSPAFRVEWLDATGKAMAPPAQNDLYFRGPVLSTFDGSEWKPWSSQQGRLQSTPANLKVFGEPIRYRVTMEPSSRPGLLLLDAAKDHPKLRDTETRMSDELNWFAYRPITDVTRFEAVAHLNFRHGQGSSARQLEAYKALPTGPNPRTLKWAQDLRRELPPPAEPSGYAAYNKALMAKVLNHLRTGGYEYTLEPGIYGTHSADEFWFDRKQGFCEHISSAFVIAMRALDIPARIVTGYQGGSMNSVDNFFTVRQSDAHAWAEVWFEGDGWVRVDPTGYVAPSRVAAFERLIAPQGVVGSAFSAMVSPSMLVQLRSVWEAVNNAWNQRILNYTQSKQLDLLKNLGFDSPSWQDLAKVLIGLLVIASLIGAALQWYVKSRIDPWVRLLDQAKAKLATLGIPSTPATPARDLAKTASATLGSAADPLAKWLHDWDIQRYAPQPASDAQRLSLLRQNLVNALRQLPSKVHA